MRFVKCIVVSFVILFQGCTTVKLPRYKVEEQTKENKKTLMVAIQSFKCSTPGGILASHKIVEKGTSFDVIDVSGVKLSNGKILPKYSLYLPIFKKEMTGNIDGFLVYPNGKMVCDTSDAFLVGFFHNIEGWTIYISNPYDCNYDITKPVFKMKKPIGEE